MGVLQKRMLRYSTCTKNICYEQATLMSIKKGFQSMQMHNYKRLSKYYNRLIIVWGDWDYVRVLILKTTQLLNKEGEREIRSDEHPFSSQSC